MKLILYYTENASQGKIVAFTFDRFSEKCLSVESSTHSIFEWLFDILVAPQNIFILSLNSEYNLKIAKCSEKALNCVDVYIIVALEGKDVNVYQNLPAFTASGPNSHIICLKNADRKVYCAVTNANLSYGDSAALVAEFSEVGLAEDEFYNVAVTNWKEDEYIVGFNGSSSYTLISVSKTGNTSLHNSGPKVEMLFLTKSRERNRVFLGGSRYVLEFEYSTSFTLKWTVDYDNYFALALFASFGENKHFVLFLLQLDNVVQSGISFKNDPLSVKCQTDTNTFICLQSNSISEEEKIVSKNGMQYLSLNKAQNAVQVDSIIVSQQNEMTDTECTGNFVYIGSSKKCLDSCTLPYKTADHNCLSGCPSSSPYISSVSGFNTPQEKGTCVSNCSTGYILKEESILYSNTSISKEYCLLSCPSTFSKIYVNTALNLKECTNSCDPQVSTKTRTPAVNYELVVGSETQCVSSCPHYRKINNLSNLDSPNNAGICLDNCSGKFSFLHPTDSTVKYCVDSCSAPYPYREGTICKANCGSDLISMPTGQLSLSTLEANELKECVSSCTHFYFNSTLTYADSSTKHYCLPECPVELYKEVNGTTKRCLASCDQNSAFKYKTSSKDCLSECNSTFPFKKLNQTECLSKCEANQFINMSTNPNQYSNLAEIQAGERGFECVNDCYDFKLHSTFVYTGTAEKKDYCLAQCPPTHFSQQISGFNKVCVEECDVNSTFKYSTPDKKCVSDCSSEGKPLIISDNNALTCNSSCSSAFPYKRTVSSLIYCVNSCESTEFIDLTGITTDETTVELKNREVNSNCSTSCTQFAFNTGVKQPNMEDKIYCLSKCPSDKPFKANPSGNLPFCYANCTEALPFKYTNGVNCLQNCASVGKSHVEERENTLLCVDSCREGTYLKVESGLNTCKSRCAENEYLSLSAENLTKLNLEFKEQSATCVSACSGFVYRSDNKYSYSSFKKTYCFASCPAGLFTLEDNSKLCVTQCDSLSTHKYRTDSMKCVSDCQIAGYNYVLEDLSCSNTCTEVLDGSNCIKACTKDKKYKENGKCVKKCSKPFISEYYECVDKCPGKFHGRLCVEECAEPRLISFYTDNGMVYEPRPVALSTGECALKCTENKAKYLDSALSACVHRCPANSYTGEDNVCLPNCNSFPFRDQIARQCLSKCRQNRPFVLPNSSECLEKCPPDLPTKTEMPNGRIECRKGCLPEMVRKDGNCLKTCPQFYSPNNQKECILDCNPQFGLVKKGEESCLHCFRDLGKFFLEGNCVDFCPAGQSFNQNFVCLPCFSLGLWTNELNRCVKLRHCKKNSYFDFKNRICGICKRKGWLLLVNEGKQAVCSNEACSGGHLESEKGVNYCYKCKKEEFYLNKQCLSDCPFETTYNLVEKACVPFCSNYCSTGCCVNGKCKNDKCDCKTGFTGTRCDIPILDSTQISEEIRQFTLKRFNLRLLVENETEIVGDLTEITSNLRVFDAEKTVLFLESAISLVEYFNTEGVYDERVFVVLDKILGLSSILRARTGISKFTVEIAGMIDNYSSLINIHNLTPNREESFEKVFNKVFEGENFSFSFGFDARTEKRVDLSACIDYSARFAYKLLRYHINLPVSLVAVEEKSMLLSSWPRVEYSLFNQSGKVNLNEVCSPEQVNKEFPAEISPQNQSLATKFLDSPVNLFDKSDPFFVDRCVPFSEDNKDITLTERKKYKLDSKTACAETKFEICTVVKKKDHYHCSCQGLRNRKKSVLENIANTFPQSNFVLFGCTKVFSTLKLLENKGFYMISVPFVFSLLLATFYSFRRNTHLKTDGKLEYLRQDGVLFDPETMNLRAYFSECAELQTTIVKFGLVAAAKGSSKHVSHKKGILPTIPELDCLAPKELLEFDTRSSFQFAVDTIKEEHYLMNVLFKRSLGSTPVFEVIVYFTEINLGITMNAFFIDDSLVENRNSSETMGVVEILQSELPKTVWALATSKLACSLISFFVSEDFARKAAVSTAIVEGNPSGPRRVYDKYLLAERWTQIGFLLCVVGLNCTFVYFVSIYAEVYQNSMGIWFDGIVIGLVVDIFIVELVGPLLIIATKEIALKYPQMLWLYSAATILKDFKKLKA